MFLRKKGFTLIELLVVMAILGILAALGFASFRTAQIKSRDARRKHNLAQFQKALELYHNDMGRYPDEVDLPDGGESWTVNGYVYLKEMPTDPHFGDHPYVTDANGSQYEIYGRLENSNDACFAATPTGSRHAACRKVPTMPFRIRLPR